MRNSKPLSLIFCTLLFATISTPVSNHKIIPQKETNLIEETCKQTPHHDLCVQYLLSDPRSSNADVTGLALIMVNVIKAKADNALDKIHQLLQEGSETDQKEALILCAGRYKAILEADVPQAVAALQKGDPKFAEDGANDAVVEATSCENSFSGKSPLTYHNNARHDAAATTAAIVRQLL
ncbi:cell wall / vacuolar inhibitor of fructosidase 1-like [Abrus precatorius]|uniref:Cell wall / vacuolar inhibitor of fructosidase 1-like n=1 Tax=Abrus precatorius TaxID=3816 RepID=A0A8B8JP33_ABRPR|nr:cell wall / vacuolar inhibitor of fructosidase 1-like [Abrus precatorius]